jgi:hypothetical protein
MTEQPTAATHFINGLFYKTGSHSFKFYWSSDSQEWRKSDKKFFSDFENKECKIQVQEKELKDKFDIL